LIAEHEIEPISPKWEGILEVAEEHFRDVQRKRLIS